MENIREYNKRIIDEFPFYALVDDNYSTTNPEEYSYDFTEIDTVPQGWRDLMMCLGEDIKEELIKSGNLYDFRPLEIKEKFGRLEFYHNGMCNEEVDRIIEDYSLLSKNVCMGCGKPDVLFVYNSSWVYPACRKCYGNDDIWDKCYNSEKSSKKMPDTRVYVSYSNGTEIVHVRDISQKAERIRKKYYDRINN